MLVFCAISLVFILSIKLILFDSYEYTSDLFSLLQASRSYLSGMPIFWMTRWGGDSWHHQHFLLLFLGPITYLYGAIPIFILHAFLIFCAAYALLRRTSNTRNGSWPWSINLIFALLLGPIGFYLFDDILYGWHVELLYVPLNILFAVDLVEKRKRAWLWALLMVLNREDGPVLCCSTQLLCFLTTSNDVKGGIRSIFKILGFWIVVFICGMLILRSHTGPGRDMLTTSLKAIPQILHSPALRNDALSMFKSLMLILAAGFIALAPKCRLRLLGWGFICGTPLVVLTFLASLAYLPDLKTHNMLWAPRLGILWSHLICVCWRMVDLNFADKQMKRLVHGWRLWGYRLSIPLLISSLLFQAVWLELNRGYPLRSRILVAYDSRMLLSHTFDHAEQALLTCLDSSLDMPGSLVTENMLFAAFDRHNYSAPEGESNLALPPQLVVCDTRQRLPFSGTCLPLISEHQAKGMIVKEAGGIRVALAPDSWHQLRSCFGS